jgi:cytochrome c oxidase subunit IV
VQQKDFLQDLGLLMVKNQLPLQFVENIWFNIRFNTCVLDLFSLSKSSFLKKYYHIWWEKIRIIYIYVLPKLVNYIFTTNFDLWMSKGVHDFFGIVINSLGFDW